MNKNEAEEILGVDCRLYPYSIKYLKSLCLRKANSSKCISFSYLRKLKEAYDYLVEETMLNISFGFMERIKLDLTPEEEDLIFDNVLNIVENKDIPDYLRKNVNSFYFHLCSLIPEDSFITCVNFLGGIEHVFDDKEAQHLLARRYKVSPKWIRMRLADLYLSEDDENYYIKLKKVINMRNSKMLY